MRIVLALGLVFVGVVSGLAAYGVLHYLWADYQDSPTSTYLMVGLPLLALSIAALAGAVLVVRRRPS